MTKYLILFISLIFCLNLLFTPSSHAVTLTNIEGEKIFELNCAGCHPNGNNIIRRGKTLKLKALHRNGYDSVETITGIVTNGKNNMSAFANRLSETEIQQVANYVLQQAENNWKS